MSSNMHTTVLLKESVEALNLERGAVVVDGTLGAGGHSLEICNQFGSDVKVVAFDLDTDAIDRAKARIEPTGCNITYHQVNFKDLDQVLVELSIPSVDGILLDLGFSSDQLESGGRGISFKKDEPLQMTLKKVLGESEFDASDIVNTWAEEDIANVIYAYGEERFARRIAREIVETRDEAPLKTTTDLVKVIMSAVPSFYRHGKIHPATKTFQALRIAVNGELESLKIVLVKGFDVLKKGGRFSIITFHSLEDRIVKNFFRDKDKEGLATLVTKKPIVPSDEELKENPRARSAKLRTLQKI